MKAKRKRRMSRRRRERTYIAVMVLLAIAVSIGLTRSVMRDDKEFEEYEQQSQEFNARMQRIDEKREASGQNAMLEQVRTWQQEQDTEPDKYAVFDTMSADWGRRGRMDSCSMRYRRNTVGQVAIFRKRCRYIHIASASSTGSDMTLWSL